MHCGSHFGIRHKCHFSVRKWRICCEDLPLVSTTVLKRWTLICVFILGKGRKLSNLANRLGVEMIPHCFWQELHGRGELGERVVVTKNQILCALLIRLLFHRMTSIKASTRRSRNLDYRDGSLGRFCDHNTTFPQASLVVYIQDRSRPYMPVLLPLNTGTGNIAC